MTEMHQFVITVQDITSGSEITHEITSYSPVRALEHAVNNTRILVEQGELSEMIGVRTSGQVRTGKPLNDEELDQMIKTMRDQGRLTDKWWEV